MTSAALGGFSDGSHWAPQGFGGIQLEQQILHKLRELTMVVQPRALGPPGSILWTQSALNSSALSLSPLGGGDILLLTRPTHGISTLPPAINRPEQTFLTWQLSSHPALGLALAKCRSQHFTCGQPGSPSGRGGQGQAVPMAHSEEAGEKHFPKQL